MARPKAPLIDPAEATAKALELIDRDGAESFNVRRLALELGVSPSSLYHHFDGKADIVRRVCWLVLGEGDVMPRYVAGRTWQQYVTDSAIRYHRSLLRHPNVAPLITPSIQEQRFTDPIGTQATARLLADGVPRRFVYAIIDSVNTLAYGSAVLNSPAAQADGVDRDGPSRMSARSTGPRSPERLFRMQLEALIQGWTTVIEGAKP